MSDCQSSCKKGLRKLLFLFRAGYRDDVLQQRKKGKIRLWIDEHRDENVEKGCIFISVLVGFTVHQHSTNIGHIAPKKTAENFHQTDNIVKYSYNTCW